MLNAVLTLPRKRKWPQETYWCLNSLVKTMLVTPHILDQKHCAVRTVKERRATPRGTWSLRLGERLQKLLLNIWQIAGLDSSGQSSLSA